jgi:hypothetical protein
VGWTTGVCAVITTKITGDRAEDSTENDGTRRDGTSGGLDTVRMWHDDDVLWGRSLDLRL